MTYEMTVGEHVFKVGAKDFDRLRVGDGAEVHFIPETDYLLKISPATLADTSGSEPTVLQTPGYDGQLVALEPEESALIRKKLIEAFLVRTLLFGVLLALPIVFIAIVNPLPWGETSIVPLLISGAAIPYLLVGLPLLAFYFWLNKQTVYLYSDWKKGEKKLLKEKVLDRITSNGKIYRYGSPRPNDSEKWYRTGPMYSVQISKLEGNYLDTSGRWIEVESNDFQATSVGDVVTVRLAPLSELPLGIGAKP
jgi:hypothetical protein